MKTACEDCTNLMTFMKRGMRLRNGGTKEPEDSLSKRKKKYLLPAVKLFSPVMMLCLLRLLVCALTLFNDNSSLVVLMAQAQSIVSASGPKSPSSLGRVCPVG